MDHKLAEQTNAANKYLLNELTGGERVEFEEHLFDCPACADHVRSDALIVDNLKEVLREPHTERSAARWFQLNWMRLPMLLPACAALTLLVFTGYQNLVSIPALSAARVLQTHVIDSAARGQGTALLLDRRAAMFNLSFDVDSPQAYASYVCEFQNDRKESVLTVDVTKPAAAAFTLSLLLPGKKFPSGQYTAIVSATTNRTEVLRLPFVIQN